MISMKHEINKLKRYCQFSIDMVEKYTNFKRRHNRSNMNQTLSVHFSVKRLKASAKTAKKKLHHRVLYRDTEEASAPPRKCCTQPPYKVAPTNIYV